MLQSLLRASALIVAVSLTFACSTTGKSSSAPSQEAEAPRVIDPRAMEVVEKMSAYLEKQPRLRLVINDSIDRSDESGMLREFNHTRVITVQRPDRARVDATGDLEQETMYYDGKTLTMDLPGEKAYAQTATTATIDTMLDDMAARFGVRRPAGDLIRTGIAARVKQNALAASYIGKSKIDGDVCDHIALSGARADWELWVETGEKPAPRRLLIRYHGSGGANYRADIKRVETPATLDEKLFKFTPEAGTDKIEFQPLAAEKAGN